MVLCWDSVWAHNILWLIQASEKDFMRGWQRENHFSPRPSQHFPWLYTESGARSRHYYHLYNHIHMIHEDMEVEDPQIRLCQQTWFKPKRDNDKAEENSTMRLPGTEWSRSEDRNHVQTLAITNDDGLNPYISFLLSSFIFYRFFGNQDYFYCRFRSILSGKR